MPVKAHTMPVKVTDDEVLNGTFGHRHRLPRRLVLCFDGTGNSFQGNASDTNIVKLLDMFDHTSILQKHYYQPGIGTYVADGVVNRGYFGSIRAKISEAVDSGLATSFDQHVMGGYRFLMRHFEFGDRIYIFGFSRGAFTARFLARLIASVGLLASGNEEMVPFAYKVYQDYELASPGIAREAATEFMKTFRSAFCCHEPESSVGIKAHFLGLFDTVNSVGTFDLPFTSSLKLSTVSGTAHHIRHAVAIDERRVKFKASLLAQDNLTGAALDEDVKEVWFAGSHADIGGGWPAEKEGKLLSRSERVKRIWRGSLVQKGANSDKSGDYFQLSDIALKWMMDEMDKLPTDQIQWNEKNKQSFMERYNKNRGFAVTGRMHDTMALGGGCSLNMVMFWKLMEVLPIIKRWEYTSQKGWTYTRFPLNMGSTRDIPPDALFHHSVLERFHLFPGESETQQPKGVMRQPYLPHNDIHLDAPGAEMRNPPRQWKLRDAGPSAMKITGEKNRATKAITFIPEEVDEYCEPTDRVYRLACD